jgi:hypothetical protein
MFQSWQRLRACCQGRGVGMYRTVEVCASAGGVRRRMKRELNVVVVRSMVEVTGTCGVGNC